jgi:DNA polymerase
VDPVADDTSIAELLELTRQLRGQLARHAGLGAWAAPGGASARTEPADEAAPEPGDASASANAAAASDAPGGSHAPREAAPAATPGEGRADDHADPRAAVAGGAPLPADADAEAWLARGDGAQAPTADAPVVLGRRTLTEVRDELGDCTRCKLHSTRRSIVFGVGSADTPLMFVGEAPGEQEDRRGEPFVGPAGQLLDKMIEAMGWTRGSVYIANTTKCRPPNNRNPQPDELAQCMPFLHAQIRAIAPRIIVALGRPASNQLLGTDAPISALRGRFHDYARATTDGVSLKIMPTFHPAYLLRDPDKKRAAWSDLKLVMAELARLGITGPAPARG